MADFTLKEYLQDYKKTALGTFDQAISSTLAHKFQSHERIFRLLLNLNTLALSAWVGLVTWKTAEFVLDKTVVYKSCFIHILSLIFIVCSDVCIMLQSRVAEKLLHGVRGDWLNKYGFIEAKLVGMANTPGTEHNDLATAAETDIKQLVNGLQDSTYKKRERWGVRLGNWSWGTGLSGVFLFFAALIYSIYGMTNFVKHADEIQRDQVSMAEPRQRLNTLAIPNTIVLNPTPHIEFKSPESSHKK